MGLGFTLRRSDSDDDDAYVRLEFEDRPHWSYSGFGYFRTRLAAEIGITLANMPGYGAQKSMLKWPSSRVEPLVLLLHHSDCDGDLKSEECARIFPRLREICSQWSQEDMETSYDRQNALLLADMMERAATENLTLVFC